jgi:phosphoribosylglycinamide formyltransferase-1
MTAAPRLAVLVSGRGSNLQALIDAEANGRLPARIVVVGSNKPGCAALDRAHAAGIDTFALRQRDYADRAAMDAAFDAELRRHAPDLVVLAGFMRILSPDMVAGWPGRMLNIHPSLLPKYPGLDTHARALAAGDREHGASVHYVIPELDAGPVIAQVRIAVQADDDADTLAQRLLRREHALMVAAIAQVAAGEIALTPAGIQYRGATLAAPLQLNDHDVLVTDTDRPAD